MFRERLNSTDAQYKGEARFKGPIACTQAAKSMCIIQLPCRNPKPKSPADAAQEALADSPQCIPNLSSDFALSEFSTNTVFAKSTPSSK
eukprot:8886229-Pyramimonas_sp.AAC.1